MAAPAWASTSQAPAAEPRLEESARTWLGREQELEEYLEVAEVVRLEPIGRGVTNPFKADLAPGGPIHAFAWKPITPGQYHGYRESYKSEVAAYRLDQLLELGMVPVTVERRVGRESGSATMWLSPARTFKELGGPPTPPAQHHHRWNVQLVRAKMFDNLIANLDPNLGNWMVDPAWNLLRIDHSRAFVSNRRMVHEMTRIDRDLWERIQALDEDSLTVAMAGALDRRQIKALLKRREVMADKIAELVKAKGEAAVFVDGG